MANVESRSFSNDAPHGVKEGQQAYNDWPNDSGFEVFHEDLEPVELKVSGKIPAFAAGTLYRTGPGGHQTETAKNKIFEASHWFDGFAQTHRFQLCPPENGQYITRIPYNSRHTCNSLIERVRRTGDLSSITFGQKIDPCESFFKKIMCSFEAVAGRGSRDATDINIGVTVQKNLPGLPNLPGIKRKAVKDESAAAVSSLWLKTDNSTFQQLDPASL